MTKETTKIFRRDFGLTFLVQITMSFVYCFLIPTLPIYLSKIGSTEVEIGVLIGAASLSSLVLRPFVGRALARIPEATCMMTGAFLYALTSASYLFAVPFWPLLAVRALQGVGAALFWTASVTLVANVSPEARLGQSLSLYYMAYNIAFALAPPLGVYLVNVFSFKLLFLVCTGLTLISLFIIAKLGRRDRSSEPPVENAPLLDRKAFLPGLTAFVSSMAWGAISSFFPLYAIHHGMANPGLFFSTCAVMIVVGRGLGGRLLDLYRKDRVILPCLTTYIVAMSILFFFKSVPMFLAAAAIWGMGHGFLYPALVAYMLERTPSSRSTTMATFSGLDDLGTGLGPVMMGIILRLAGYRTMFLCLVLLGFFNLGYFYLIVKKRMGIPRADPSSSTG